MASSKRNTFDDHSSTMSTTTTASDSRLLQVFHDASANGDKRRVKRCLKSVVYFTASDVFEYNLQQQQGVDVDCIDKHGRTALFTACLEGHEGVVNLLLKYGANVNQRIPEGSTPVHAASYGSSVRVLRKLVELGGDVRLHDVNGLVVRNWAQRQMNISKRKKNVDFLLENQRRAVSCAGRSTTVSSSSGPSATTSLGAASDSLKKLKSSEKNKKVRCPLNDYIMVNNFGYGPMFICRFGDSIEVNGNIPLIRENTLKHDQSGPTYNNGPYMVMESMLWNKVKVTVKRLHREPVRGGHVDLLISESDISTRLRHSNIMLMMAVCHTSNMENMVLLYERVDVGSLFMHVYTQGQKLNEFDVCRILSQISSALLYVHQRGIVHCALSSHAIQLSSDSSAKLSNFEYAAKVNSPVGSIKPGTKPAPKSALLIENQLEIVFNWAAPEVLAGHPFTYSSDVYSLCALLWETMHGVVPWRGLDIEAVRREFAIQGLGLVKPEDVHRPYDNLLRVGLALDVQSRDVTVEQFHNTMSMALTASQVAVPQETMVLLATNPNNPENATSMASSSPWRRSKLSPRPTSAMSNDRQRQRQRFQQLKQHSMEESTDDTIVGAAPLPRLSRRMNHRSSRQQDNMLRSSSSLTSVSSNQLINYTIVKAAVQTVSGDSPTVDLGADENERSLSVVFGDKPVAATKFSKSPRYNEARLTTRLNGGDSCESSSTISSRGNLRRRSNMAFRTSDIEARGCDGEDIIDNPPSEHAMPVPPPTSDYPPIDATDHGPTRSRASRKESQTSSSRSRHRDIDHDENGMASVRAARLHEARASSTDNPFRSELLNRETIDMYHAMLKRPLPRLPKLYTLPSRRLAEERPTPRNVATQSSTVCGTLLRHYSPVFGQSYRALDSDEPLAGPVQLEPLVRSPVRALVARNYPPTFGISLNELKAAIAPRASAIQNYVPIDCAYDSNRKENCGTSSYQITNTEAPLVHIQPASHHRPSNVDSVSNAKPLSPLSSQFNRRSTQPLTCMMPTAGSLNSVCAVTTTTTSTAGSLSNPLVGVSQLLPRSQVAAKVFTTALKPAATMPLPADSLIETDYMLRFRSDPILLHGYEETDLDSQRPNPPPCSPVGDYETNAIPNAELDMDCPSRNIRDLISQYQDQCSELSSNKVTSFNLHRQTVDAATDPIFEGEFASCRVPSTVMNSLHTSTTVYGVQAVSTSVIGDVTIRKFHRTMEGSSSQTASTQTPPSDTGVSKLMHVQDAEMTVVSNGEPSALSVVQQRNAEQKTSVNVIPSRSRSETDEETSHMVTSALKQAKVDLVHKYASKQPADMIAVNGNDSLPDPRESMDIRDVRRFMLSPLKNIIKDNANNNNEFLTSSLVGYASRNMPLGISETYESINNQEAATTASASSTACSCGITPQESVSDDFTQSDDRSHGSIIQKIKSITQTLLLSSDSTTSSRASSASDIYFDDEFSGASFNKQERHMRLNTTLNLDNQSSGGRFRSPFLGVNERTRALTGDGVKTGDSTAVSNGEVGSLHCDANSSCESKLLDYSHVLSSSGRTASTIIIKTDEYGQHRISVRKTGTTPLSGGRTRKIPHMRTQVILDHDNVDEHNDSTQSLI